MKRRIIPVLLLCLLLAACAPNADPTQPSGTQPTSSSGLSDSNNDFLTVRLHTFDTLEEYRQFTEETKLPEDFVYYEDLTQFGEFYALVLYPTKKTDKNGAVNYREYNYSFLDEDGTRLGLYIRKDYSERIPVDSKYWGDMQVGDPFIDKEHAYVVRNGIGYLYLGGNLTYIVWENNGIQFTLHTSVKGEVFYPKDGPLTIVHDLLHTDTNKAAIERFEAGLKEFTAAK